MECVKCLIFDFRWMAYERSDHPLRPPPTDAFIIKERIVTKLLFALALVFPLVVAGAMVITLPSQPSMACHGC
jgi:hypothetical protein